MIADFSDLRAQTPCVWQTPDTWAEIEQKSGHSEMPLCALLTRHVGEKSMPSTSSTPPRRGMSNLNMVTAEETDFIESDNQKRALPKVTPVLALLDVVVVAACILASLVASIMAIAGV